MRNDIRKINNNVIKTTIDRNKSLRAFKNKSYDEQYKNANKSLKFRGGNNNAQKRNNE